MENFIPIQLLNSLEGVKGFNNEAFLKAHNEEERITSIRFNRAKLNFAGLSADELFTGEPVPWCDDGIYLEGRPSFTLDPLFHAGAYYVQEASSMFLQEALKQTIKKEGGLKVLDLCGAPGGKSTLLQSFFANDDLLVCNEVVKTRVSVLEENVIKWGAHNVVVTNNDPLAFSKLPSFFDVMVVDAPCSGSGLFRKDRNAVKEWSLENVELCARRQKRILTDSLPALKEDGLLFYCTCSFSELENENVVDELIATHSMQSVRLNTGKFAGIVEVQTERGGFGYRFYPDKIGGEGFFISVLKKSSPQGTYKIEKENKSFEKLNANSRQMVEEFVEPYSILNWYNWQHMIVAFIPHFINDLAVLQKHLYVKYAGLFIGEIAGKVLVPHHALALNKLLHTKFNKVEIDKQNALDYLRRNDFNFECTLSGWTILSFKNINLGFAKILPTRLNNYYPKQWRIINK